MRIISQRSETPFKHITLATQNASDIFLTVYDFLSVFEGIPCSEWLLYKHVCNMSAIASQTYKYVIPLPPSKARNLKWFDLKCQMNNWWCSVCATGSIWLYGSIVLEPLSKFKMFKERRLASEQWTQVRGGMMLPSQRHPHPNSSDVSSLIEWTMNAYFDFQKFANPKPYWPSLLCRMSLPASEDSLMLRCGLASSLPVCCSPPNLQPVHKLACEVSGVVDQHWPASRGSGPWRLSSQRVWWLDHPEWWIDFW